MFFFPIRWLTFPFDVVNALQGLILFCAIFFDSKKIEMICESCSSCYRQSSPERSSSSNTDSDRGGGGGKGGRRHRRTSNMVTMCTTVESSTASFSGPSPTTPSPR